MCFIDVNNTNYPDTLFNELSNELNNNKDNTLFEYQNNVFNYMTKLDKRGILLYHAVGTGKCMGINTPILMYDGTIKYIQNITIDDKLMGDDSTERNVLSIVSGVDNMYNVWYGNLKYVVNESHILCLKLYNYPKIITNESGHIIIYTYNNKIEKAIFSYSNSDNKKNIDNQAYHFYNMSKQFSNIIEITVRDYINLPSSIKENLRGYKTSINFNTKQCKIDAYNLGTWLITDMYNTLYNSTFLNHIKSYNLKINNKFIPYEFKCNDFTTRRQILAGIFDTAGKVIKYKGFDSISIHLNYTKNILLNDILYVANSIGLLFIKKIKYDINHNKYYKIIFYGKELQNIPLLDLYLQNVSNESFDDGYKIKIKYFKVDRYYGFVIDNNSRYLLGDFTVTHNTMTSVSIAEHFKKLNQEIIIISSKSLQINYKKEIINYNKLQLANKNNDIDLNEEELLKNYKFITSNSKNMISSLTNENSKTSTSGIEMILSNINKSTLENKIIIVDEAHNLFNSISNGSIIANEFYDMVMNTKKLKIIFMTGTPVINDPFELCICYNMIHGNMNTSKLENKKRTESFHTILPEYYTDFHKYFIDEKNNDIKNIDKFKNRIYGLTSYYGEFYDNKILSISDELKKTIKKENYPDRLPIKFEVIEMSIVQNAEYVKARDIERLENSFKYGSAINKAKSTTSTSYRIKSRQLSNIFIDKEKLTLDNINIYSSKMNKIFENINSNHENQISLIYSTFLDYGLLAFSKILDLHSYKKYNPDSNSNQHSYAIFSGDQTIEEKTHILKIVNSEENKKGEIIKFLLISKSGSEGIDLKNIRSIHIMEPYWNFSLLQQIIARGVRYKSHIMLDEKDRNVQTYIYLSDYNQTYLKSEKERLIQNSSNKKKIEPIEYTTDINMLKNAIKNQELIVKFLKCIASTSIECKMFNKEQLNYNCFSCYNNNKPLYIPNIHVDMVTSNNCIQKKNIKAEEIIINDNKYYYSYDNDNNLMVFQKHKSMDGYLQIHDDEIIKKIKSL